MPEIIIEGGRRRLKPGAIPVLFDWNNFSLPVARPSVWQRTQRQAEDEELIDASVSLMCHDYDMRPDPSALDLACEKIDAQQQAIVELQKRLQELSLRQSFGLERFKTSDEDIRFYTRFASYRHFLAFWLQIEPATRRIVRVGQSSTTSDPDTTADLPRRPSRCLPLVDELFLFLVYLSLKEKDLADRFNIHQSTDHPSDWDKYIRSTVFGLQTKMQLTTKYSPYYLMYGREARYPLKFPLSGR
ncbi:uncharacterized protein LOC124475453 isoform X2 [Hypomesus transpacificus]|nr:uncharacterized protein LOC124475453 isoform X2 [Hypomesus transpacificus]